METKIISNNLFLFIDDDGKEYQFTNHSDLPSDILIKKLEFDRKNKTIYNKIAKQKERVKKKTEAKLNAEKYMNEIIEEENKPSPFSNATDPRFVTPMPDVIPVPEPIKPDDSLIDKMCKEKNVTIDDVKFLKECKLHFNIDSDKSLRLWHIHLKLFGKYPTPDDRFCGGCVSKALNKVWEEVAVIYLAIQKI